MMNVKNGHTLSKSKLICRCLAYLSMVAAAILIISEAKPCLALLSASQVEKNVLGGRKTIINRERDSWNEMTTCHKNRDNGTGNHRTCVNETAYTNYVWLMSKNGNTNSITVDAGIKEIKLRIKHYCFMGQQLCLR